MRLGDLLSKPPKSEYEQVDGFVLNKKGDTGQQVELDIGQIALNYFCTRCNDLRTFCSKGKLRCVFVNKKLISIDCVLLCSCETSVQLWFLVECDRDITMRAPMVRILKRSERLSNAVRVNPSRYEEFAVLIDKAERAYREGFGAGSIVYLRKIFEMITVQTADAIKMDYPKYDGGNPKNFSELLKKVDQECNIIPEEFSSNKYKLFRELSSVIHGEYDEELGLRKFEPLHRLVLGILEKVKNRNDLQNAIKTLGWGAYENDK